MFGQQPLKGLATVIFEHSSNSVIAAFRILTGAAV